MSSIHKKILIVEDDIDIRTAMSELLMDSGYEIATANHGQAALDLLDQDPHFDLILLDLMMPIMDGFDFRNRQKTHPKISKIPVIIMSADGHVSQKMQRALVTDYVKKPMDLDDLLRTIADKFRESVA